MRAIIVGCGRVGAQLASLLSLAGHQVAIVDRNSSAFETLAASFHGERITGDGIDHDVLKQAKIDRADAFASVTNSDNVNIIAALVARDAFKVPHVVTRMYDPERAEIYRRLGIPTISAATWAANEILQMLIHSNLSSRMTLGNGEVQFLETDLPPTLSGRAVNELLVPGEIMVTAIVRHGKALVPYPGSTLHEGDVIYIAALSSAMTKLRKLLDMA
ncbi:MAG TPA: potassium transporter TrkA [Syntrophobacteraceae bacterium]|nr:potassium transporter TrkA [Syntrophobacteraceae bacterium]